MDQADFDQLVSAKWGRVDQYVVSQVWKAISKEELACLPVSTAATTAVTAPSVMPRCEQPHGKLKWEGGNADISGHSLGGTNVIATNGNEEVKSILVSNWYVMCAVFRYQDAEQEPPVFLYTIRGIWQQ